MTVDGNHTQLRPTTPIDELCNQFVDDCCQSDPFMATSFGVRGLDEDVCDYSPDGAAEQAAIARSFKAAVSAEKPVDAIDEVTQDAVVERMDAQLALYDAHLLTGDANVIASPVQGMRDIFDLMPQDEDGDWNVIASRLSKYPQAIASYRLGLAHAAEHGTLAAVRQLNVVAEQIDQLIDPKNGQLFGMVGAATKKHASEATIARLESAIADAAESFTDLATHIRTDLVPTAPTKDACGRDHHALWSRYFLGATIDAEEMYAWGIEELADIEDQMLTLAKDDLGSKTIEDAIAALSTDPVRSISDAEAFRDWMQAVADEAVTSLDGVHFDIPTPIKKIECCLAGSANGGIYYTPPSEDFSRPGRMWWSVPPQQTSFETWSERTTVYHEGVPGHHLQFGQTMVLAGSLNRWRRMMCWTSGHAEGWALYAEKLMAELGFLDDPGDRMGMLSAAAMRAMRVVIDLGVHCEFKTPAELGGKVWTADDVRTYQRSHARIPESVARFEHLRYLGWPGQASSYKIGEQLWIRARDQVSAQQGAAFSAKQFHHDALALGGMGLDTMTLALSQSR